MSTEPSAKLSDALAHVGIDRGQALGIQLQRQERRSAGEGQSRRPRMLGEAIRPKPFERQLRSAAAADSSANSDWQWSPAGDDSAVQSE